MAAAKINKERSRNILGMWCMWYACRCEQCYILRFPEYFSTFCEHLCCLSLPKMQSTELFSDNALTSSAPEPERPLQQLPENTMPSSQPDISWKCEHCPRIFQTDRGCKQHQGKCTSSVPKKISTISDLSKQCLRGFKTQACSTVSPAVPITIKVISPIVSNVVRNDPPVWGSLSSADLHQIVNAVYDEQSPRWWDSVLAKKPLHAILRFCWKGVCLWSNETYQYLECQYYRYT